MKSHKTYKRRESYTIEQIKFVLDNAKVLTAKDIANELGVTMNQLSYLVRSMRKFGFNVKLRSNKRKKNVFRDGVYHDNTFKMDLFVGIMLVLIVLGVIVLFW